MRMIAATAAATTDAARIANLALFWLVGSVKANSVTKMATVNPIPAAAPIPIRWRDVEPAGVAPRPLRIVARPVTTTPSG